MPEAPPNNLNDLLGDVIQICLVTRDHKRTMDGLMRLGIGPWRMHIHSPATISQTRLRGEDHTFTCIMGFAFSANMMWEVVEPLEGTGIFDEFLKNHPDGGVHHVGYTCPGRNFHEAIAEFERRGFQIIQSGRVWNGQVGFAFIGAYDELGVFFEIWDHPPNFTPPAPDSWYPAPPTDEMAK
jgi:hypothetical protein